MLGYQLFDMLSWVTGCGGQMSQDIPRTFPALHLPEKLETLVNCLKDWTTIIPAAETLAIKAGQQAVPLAITIQESTAPQWKSTIRNLFNISHQQGQAEWHRILRNFYSMAFIISWFSLVSL
jgi:hypothetical protein